MNIDTEILLANQIQEHTKRIIYHDQMGLIPSEDGLTYANQ